MEYFNFLGLPDVVQDLIVHEIVHNSIPEDRIQLARTCKYLNEAVKRAKPKKIIEQLDINFFNDISFDIGTKSFESLPTPEFFTNICQILQQIQIEKLSMIVNSVDVKETQDSGFFHHLFEASKFLTEFRFSPRGFFPEFLEFYNKLEHLEFLNFSDSVEMFKSLSYLPSRMKLGFGTNYDSSLLENIIKKTKNKPLSSLYFNSCIPMKDLQQFLQTTKFEKGCEIHCKVENSEGETIHIFMTFIDDEQGFEIETFSTGSLPIIADQKYDGKEKRILNLSVMELLTHFKPINDAYPWMVPFNVTMKTQPTEPVFSDYLEDVDEDYVLENIKENDWIKINIIPQNIVNVRYSNKMLDSNFPRNEFATAQERVTFINATLGCQMSIIKAEKLTDTIQNHENGRIPVPDSLRGNNRKRRPPSYLEDESD